MTWYRKKLSNRKAEHIEYVEFLLSGEKYNITISKRYLFRTLLPFWLELLVLFSLSNKFIFGYVILPNLILYGVFVFMLYGIWKLCNISPKAYIIFHIGVLIILYLLAIPFGYLLEVLWIFCF